MNLWLFAGLACLGIWFVFTFVSPIGMGVVHVPLGVGLVALVVWWGSEKGEARSEKS